METIDNKEKRTHHGHAVKRLRQTLGIKQGALAADMGLSQQTISTYEQKPVIEDEILEKFAKALDVSIELIKDLEEDPITITIENNTFENKDGNNIAYLENDYSTNTYNPVDKIIELCEKLLEADKEKIALLEKLLKEKR